MLYVQYACAATAGLMIIGHMAKIVAVQSGTPSRSASCSSRCSRSSTRAAGSWPASSPTTSAASSPSARVRHAGGRDVLLRRPSPRSARFIARLRRRRLQLRRLPLALPRDDRRQLGHEEHGLNYGILFTAWGVGGVIGPMLAGRIADRTGSYAGAYSIAGSAPLRVRPRDVQLHERVGQHPGEEVRIRIGRRPTEPEEVPAVFPPQARAVAGAGLPLHVSERSR